MLTPTGWRAWTIKARSAAALTRANTGASPCGRHRHRFGQNGVPRRTGHGELHYPARAATTSHPAEWLQLQRVPAAQQDNAGGVLYTVNLTAPASGSDFYVDVIAYDKAVFPNIPNTGYQGTRTNWRIYDNVGGFSTNQSIGNNDILVVSDYALGQKFAATTFGGRNTNLNLVPKLFGTESYLTDIDVSYLPDSVYAGIPTTHDLQYNPVSYGYQGELDFQYDADHQHPYVSSERLGRTGWASGPILTL